MTNETAIISERFAGLRTGYELLRCEPAAVPFAQVTARAVLQIRKPVAPIDEFVLRAVGSGVTTREELIELFGLDEETITRSISQLYASDQLDSQVGPAGRELKVTQIGRQTVSELVEIVPSEQEIWFWFDLLLMRPSAQSARSMLKLKEAQARELMIVKPSRSGKLAVTDLRTDSLNVALNQSMKSDVVDVLAVKELLRQEARYLPCYVLLYESADSLQHAAEVVVDGRIQPGMGLEIERLGIEKHLEITFGIPAAEEQNEVRHVDNVVKNLKTKPEPKKLRSAPLISDSDDPEVLTREPSAIHVKGRENEIRNIDTFEHSDLLHEALDQAVKRLLVVSPWVRGAVVNRTFIDQLRSAARRKVRIHIGYGIDSYADGSHADAINRLHLVANEFQNVTVACLGNTHAKTLIWDDNFVSTSFNWLSFRGDKDRTYRQETGLLIRGKNGATDQQWKSDSAAIESAAAKE